MLDKKRIKEAEQNVKNYINDGLLKKSFFKEIVFSVLRNNAKESLNVAELLAKEESSDLWVIVASYYSMYYIANAVIYKLGYKIGEKISHRITADSLIVFVRDKLKNQLIEEYEEMQQEALAGIKADSLIEAYDYERRKRSIIQYETKEFEKHSKAQTSLKRAKEFMFEMEKLID
jgi:hypothetical protein